MRLLVVATTVVVAVLGVTTAERFFRQSSPYSYECNEGFCKQTDRGQAKEYRTQETCQLTCGDHGAIWPKPTGRVQLSKEVVSFNPENMEVTKIAAPSVEVSNMIDEAYGFFRRSLHFLHPDFQQSKKTPYTEDQKAEFTQTSQKERLIQKTTIINQQERASDLEFPQQEIFESWERYSPFLNQKYNPGVERQNVKVEVTVNSPEKKMTINTDESYELEVKTVDSETLIKIRAPTYFGARHAFETLSQLIAFDSSNEALMIVRDTALTDAPQFKYRGFMLDTSRNYYPKEELMRLFDAMSQNKMNYFQWHLTDAASFPMYSDSRPEMAYYGAYSPRKVYYPNDIKEVVEYARLRGINVVPEINAPGHSNAGWTWGDKSGKGQLVLCTGNQQPWFNFGEEAPAGQLNPVNPEVYNVLGEIYRDVVEYFDPEMVHMGGDSVNFNCWKSADEVKEYLAANGKEASDKELNELWNTFQSNAYAKLTESAGRERPVTPIIHSSEFARNYIDKNTYVIQVDEFTSEAVIAQYVQDGYKVIFSNLDQWRLDCLDTNKARSASAQCPAKIATWKNFYSNSPLDFLTELGVPNTRLAKQNPQQQSVKDNILGGTVTLYSSETDANGLHPKAWPRTSAMAERLWSDPSLPLQGTDSTQKRLNLQRQRMVYRGINASPSQPELCMHDEKACYSKEEYAARSANIPQTAV